MKKNVVRMLLCMLPLFGLSSREAMADDLSAIFKKVGEYVEAKNYPKALEELTWARKEIEKMNMKQMENLLPDSVAGFTGAKVVSNSAMGFTNLEREYSKDSISVKASLTGGSGAGLGAGMAGFGQMAAMMGNMPGQDTVRIDGRTALLESNDSSKTASLSVFLESGSILKLDMEGSSDGSTLKTFAEALKVGEIDKYLKG